MDDNATNRTVFREQLKVWGCQTGEAVNGAQALAMLKAAVVKEKPFELAIVDFNMAGMDGEELARHIRSEDSLAKLPLILVTSVPRRGDAAKMLEAGFNAYLTKPARQSQLYASIATVMGIEQVSETAEHRSLVTQHTLNEAARARFKILVVEDNIVNQKVAARMLEKAGYRCDVAANGREAVQAIARIDYDLVLMDIMMPEMDGYEATREIRRREGEIKHTTIVAMTAHAMKGDRELCLEAGMDDYISKPVTAQTLNGLLEKYLVGETNFTMTPVSPVPPRTTSVQLERIQQVSEGDRDFELELIESFLVDSEKYLQDLESALGASNAEDLRCVAHTLKGSCATTGANKMHDIAYRLEKIGERGDLGLSRGLIADLKKELKEVGSFLLDYLRS